MSLRSVFIKILYEITLTFFHVSFRGRRPKQSNISGLLPVTPARGRNDEGQGTSPRIAFLLKGGLLAFTLLVNQTAAFAGVYCCVKSDGKFEFRDTPCQNAGESQTFLPLTYQKTNQKQVKKQETDLKKMQRQTTQLQSKQERLHQRKVKQCQLEKDKTERRKIRCLRIQDKIEQIESQLRQGCKLKKSIRLQSQLEQAERQKQQYCASQ